MKVLIVGAGMAGLACAHSLNTKKYQVTIIDKTNTFGTIGYAVALWSNGFKVLEKLNIFKTLENKISIVKHDIIYDESKHFVANINFDILHLTYDMAVLTRSDLHEDLVDNLSKDIDIRMGTTILNIENSNSGVFVAFNNKEREFFDIVIGADGVRSQIRSTLFDNENLSLRTYPYRIWSFWTNTKSQSAVSFLGKGRGYIQYPSGEKAVCTALAKKSFVDDSFLKTKKERLVKSFENFEWTHVLDLEFLEEKDIFEDDMHYVSLNSFLNKRVILIGDAAHALSPLLGMGTTLALEDGVLLSDYLNEVHDSKHIEGFLKDYDEKRSGYIKRFRRRIMFVEKIYVSDGWLMKIIRNISLKICGAHLFDVLLGKYIR